MKDFFQLKKNLSKDFSGCQVFRVAVLGDTSTQFLVQALRGCGYEAGLDLQIWEAEYDQISRQVQDPESGLYQYKPEIIILFQSTHKLLNRYNKLPADQQANLAAETLENLEVLTSTLSAKLNAKIIYYNFPEIDDAVFGNHANKTGSSFLFQLRKLNYELMLFASDHPGFYLCDLSSLQNQTGRSNFFQPSVYINSEMVLSIDILAKVAERTVSILSAISGKFRKCLILDLDNTLWGGVIGDDGLENIQLGHLGIGKAYTEFQQWIKKLQKRGIILAVCSKNTESVAKEPFEKHPDMVLRPDDIAVFVSNWENKVDNIRHIQRVLNIGFDSMVFIDDNPFERNMVREHIPDICVPEMPEDPADYLEFLYAENLFETISVSGEDAERTRQYQAESRRMSVQKQFESEDDFLNSLQMCALVEPFNKFNTPRAAQLSQRSNQFNLRTLRYTDADVTRIATDAKYVPFTFTLEDRFGDNGLICVVVMKKESADTLFIENWFMSCRVLKRGMEHFVLNTLAAYAKDNGFVQLTGEYLPTAKNEMVKDHYASLGFTAHDGQWILDLRNYKEKKCFIKNKSTANGTTGSNAAGE